MILDPPGWFGMALDGLSGSGVGHGQNQPRQSEVLRSHSVQSPQPHLTKSLKILQNLTKSLKIKQNGKLRILQRILKHWGGARGAEPP